MQKQSWTCQSRRRHKPPRKTVSAQVGSKQTSWHKKKAWAKKRPIDFSGFLGTSAHICTSNINTPSFLLTLQTSHVHAHERLVNGQSRLPLLRSLSVYVLFLFAIQAGFLVEKHQRTKWPRFLLRLITLIFALNSCESWTHLEWNALGKINLLCSHWPSRANAKNKTYETHHFRFRKTWKFSEI